MLLWWKASSLVSTYVQRLWDASEEGAIVSSDGLVSSFSDPEGIYNFVQGVLSERPSTGIRTLNGRNVIDGDGSQGLHISGFEVPSSGNVTIMGVFGIDAVTNAGEGLIAMNAGEDFQLFADNNVQFDGRLQRGGSVDVPLSGGPYSGPHIWGIEYNYGTDLVTVYVDGVSRGTAPYGEVKLDQFQYFTILSNKNEGQFIDGFVAEVLVDEKTSTSFRQFEEGRLAWKWGLESMLPAGHPYENFPPYLIQNLDEITWDTRIEAENARRHNVFGAGSIALTGNRSILTAGTGAMEVADSPDWDLNQSKTISFWFKTTNGADQYICAQYDSLAVEYYLRIQPASNKAGFYIDATGGNGYMGANTSSDLTDMGDGNWHHIALVILPTAGQFRFYYDGVDKFLNNDGGTGTTYKTFSAPLDLCKRGNDIGFFDGELSQFEIANTDQRFTGASFIPPTRTDDIPVDEFTVLALDFSRPAGATLGRILDSAKPDHLGPVGFCPDISGNENDGTPSGVTYDAVNKRFIMNGSSSCISFGKKLIESGDFTIYGVSKRTLTNGYLLAQGLIASGTYTALLNSSLAEGGRVDGTLVPAGTKTLNQDYVSTLKYESGQAAHYTDSVQDGTLAKTETYTGDETRIGSAANGGAFFGGEIGAIMIRGFADSDTVREQIEQLLDDKYGVTP